MLTSVFSINSYHQVYEIRQAVHHSISSHPVISEWNPSPLRHIVVKPNWVQESHEYIPDRWECVISHPSVVHVVLDELAQKLSGQGTISICDAPHTYANFSNIVARGNLDKHLQALSETYPDLRLELIDLRREIWIREDEVVVQRRSNECDPRGYARFNLGEDSLFYGHPGEGNYYGADYDCSIVNDHHHDSVQEYLIAGTPVSADLFVNIAKLKTHKKTGITCCLKNLVGINGDKNWLPHHTKGYPSSGGDEFPDISFKTLIESKLKSLGMNLAFKVPVVGPRLYARMRSAGKQLLGDSSATIRNGNWFGNNTCWRMVLDLNRCLLYGNMESNLNHSKKKAYLGIVDGIQGGEGNGPICPDPVDSRVLIVGDNPAHIDAVSAKLMGFDPMSIPLVFNSFDFSSKYPIASVHYDQLQVVDFRGESPMTHSVDSMSLAENTPFRPHFGWTTHLGPVES